MKSIFFFASFVDPLKVHNPLVILEELHRPPFNGFTTIEKLRLPWRSDHVQASGADSELAMLAVPAVFAFPAAGTVPSVAASI